MRNFPPSQWKSSAASIAIYWRLYGGWGSLVGSPYFFMSLACTAIAYPYWSAGHGWIQNAVDIVPGLLGFSIGAFAILLVFSSDKFLSILSERGKEMSIFMLTSAMFVHFIMLQVLALLVAIIAYVYPALAGLGFFLLVYALFSAVAVAIALFNLAQIYNRAAFIIHEKKRPGTEAGNE